MKVAHLVQSFALGSLERTMSTLAEATRGAGHEAVAVAYLDGGPLAAELERFGVRTAVIRGNGAVDLALPFKLAGWLAEERVDLVHTHHLGPATTGRITAALLGVPLVHTEHGVGLGNGYRRRWHGAGLEGQAHVVASSAHVARQRRAALGTDCAVIEPGVPAPRPLLPGERTARRASLGLPADAFVVGCVGRLTKEKNHRQLVAAVAALEGAHLVLIGDGPEQANLAEQATHLGARQRMHFLGAVADPTPWWCVADVAVSTSVTAGPPLALLEAMSAGVPVVATASEGLEAFATRGAGLVVSPEGLAPLREALDALRLDGARRAQLAEAGRQHVTRHHSVREMTARYLELYSGVLTGFSRQRRAA